MEARLCRYMRWSYDDLYWAPTSLVNAIAEVVNESQPDPFDDMN